MFKKQIDYAEWCLRYCARKRRNIPFSSRGVGVCAMGKEPPDKDFVADH